MDWIAVVRAGRGLRLLRVVSSLNRSMSALGVSLSRRGFGYVTALTLLVTFAGASGGTGEGFDSPGVTGGRFGPPVFWAIDVFESSLPLIGPPQSKCFSRQTSLVSNGIRRLHEKVNSCGSPGS